MLVLTRKADEQILIGDDIKITLVKVRGGSVRIGIDAPKSVKIIRAELEPKVTQSLASSTQADSSADGSEDVDDIAAVFAHPERNQVRSGPNRAGRLAGMVNATKVTAGKAKVQKSTRILNAITMEMNPGVAVSS